MDAKNIPSLPVWDRWGVLCGGEGGSPLNLEIRGGARGEKGPVEFLVSLTVFLTAGVVGRRLVTLVLLCDIGWNGRKLYSVSYI